MTVFKHEWRSGRIAFWVWTGAIASLLFICLMMFPEMKGEMESVSRMFAAMGAFTAAFGMDKINFGDVMGFYGIECGNIIGIGGALYASLLGIEALAAEEKNHTAEFLLTHPISRKQVLAEKLLAVVTQIAAMNIFVMAVSFLSLLVIKEKPAIDELLLLHLAYTLMQVELACVCFGISAFLRKGGLGIGIGLAMLMYFLNLIGNISDSAAFLQYITPFGYAEASDIITEASLNTGMLLIGAAFTVCGIGAAFWKYTKKDIFA